MAMFTLGMHHVPVRACSLVQPHNAFSSLCAQLWHKGNKSFEFIFMGSTGNIKPQGGRIFTLISPNNPVPMFTHACIDGTWNHLTWDTLQISKVGNNSHGMTYRVFLYFKMVEYKLQKSVLVKTLVRVIALVHPP